MDNFNEIYATLSAVPGLCDSIGMEKGMAFVRLAGRLKDAITVVQPPTHDAADAPEHLPDGIRTFLGSAIDLPMEYIDGCWKAFSNIVWKYDEDGKTKGSDAEAFKRYGLDNLLSSRMLFPPSHYCNTPGCTNTNTLRDKAGPLKAVLYTLSDGACATFSTHLSCPSCRARYYPNYVVRDGTRTYYDQIPSAVQVAEHQYVERALLNLFTNLLLISWTSATNGARVYNETLSQPEKRPDHPDWMDTSFKLRPEHVWDGFLLISLLEDYEARGATLRVPHTGDQKDRFTAVMQERNTRIQLCGQPEWGHYCTKCRAAARCRRDGSTAPRLIFFVEKLHVVVIDGISIGHPCCGVLHCPNSLNRHRFCTAHAHRHNVCAVEGCEVAADSDDGFMTCCDPNHRLLETTHNFKKRDKAMFQLRTNITAEEVEELELPSDTTDPACPAAKDPSGNRKIRALFGRRKTHNEQIMVRPCGVIVARATFFGSETVTQTVVHLEFRWWDMLRKVFRADGSMPHIVFYDNNCTLYKHLVRISDPLVETVGFPVDVFHWTCKHKKEGVECAYHCNPLLFSELLGASDPLPPSALQPLYDLDDIAPPIRAACLCDRFLRDSGHHRLGVQTSGQRLRQTQRETTEQWQGDEQARTGCH
ncbi:hypothetical protein B0H16DRAFT_1342021 [Mycena metata]|uniref:CxC5 like cysteine cluster associated with KDZ domain-containing protein n=1 Tax=Mycena metata TaxID=1033252 RepID=A0AAD7H5V7_9AGAR|nr:hypothetical protein B0H16DRAFT_1342021 [Mycena metata]